MTEEERWEVNIMKIEELVEQTSKVMMLWQRMNELFPEADANSHLRMAIMVAIKGVVKSRLQTLEDMKKSAKAAGFDMISTGNPPWTRLDAWKPQKLGKITIDFIRYGNKVYEVCGVHMLGYDHDKKK